MTAPSRTNRKAPLGHCPCCGQEHKVVQGVMIKHHLRGPDKRWMAGGCSGSGHPAIEADRTMADATIQAMRKERQGIREKLAQLQEGRTHPETVTRCLWKESVEIPFDEALPNEQQEAVKMAIAWLKIDIRAAEERAGAFQRLVVRFHNKPLKTVA